jgi:alcohol dehydrogenase class IV
MVATIYLPRMLRIGAGSSRLLAETLNGLGLSSPLIVTDRYLVESGRVREMTHGLTSAQIDSRVFADTVPEPTVDSIEAGRAFLAAGRHDCVVGFGGGSPMDSAKALAVLAVHGGQMRDYKSPRMQDQPGLPVIAVPTTAGTGSEVTRFTVITDQHNDEKMLCIGQAYMPVAALVDYELTLTMPPRLTADTGIDALTHAIEAFVSKRANAFSDSMALSALSAIAPNLRRVFNDAGDKIARETLMLGATQAGIAFSNSSVALVHGMSRPIGALFHVPHGLSNAMLLPTITQYTAPSSVPRYAACARAMQIASQRDSDADAVAKLIDELTALNADLDVPSPKDYGIDAARWTQLLPLMAEQALASGSPANNPITPTAAQIIGLYEQAWYT